jgi:hypothetical protein
MQQYTISVADIVRANGLSCPPDKINIVFEQPECADVVCIQNATTITISIPDGCDQKCFYGVASCDVECDTCGDMRVEICPCMDNTGCGPCSICDPVKHICISNCGPGKICSEECGGCAECDSETPCPGDKVCQNCKCECPTDRPYAGPNGTCIDCRTKDDCPPCHECTATGCKPIVCTTGVCNDEKGCVECNSKTDCVGANKCCIDNKCDCCPGFVQDQDGNCVQIDCTKDSDCGDCQTCDTVNGKCKPTICPPGTVCVKDGCLPICDCDSPLCDTNNACIRLNESTCYCSSCSGSCANGEPCGPGCYCDKTDGKCKPNPCAGSCANGTDCGPGCGCNKLTGACEPCGSVPCGTPCDNLLGCGCPDGTNCGDLPDCGGDCTNGPDCPPGCGCFRGKCVNCANFDCVQCAEVDGCKCVGTKCETDPDRDCKDVAELIKDESNCSLTAKFDIKDPCSCAVITAGVIPTNFLVNGTGSQGNPVVLRGSFRVQLRKGNVLNKNLFLNYPLLNDTSNASILDNEMPTNGQIKAITYGIIRDELTGTNLPRVQVSEQTLSIGGLTEVTFENLNLGTIQGLRGSIVAYEVEFFVSSKLEFESDCDYLVTPLFKIAGTASVPQNMELVNQVYAIKGLTSAGTRKPALIWQKAKPGESFTKDKIFRKVYASKGTDGKYTDILYGPGEIPAGDPYPLTSPQGELWNGYNYKVSSDCSCDEASLDNLYFCNLDKFKYKFGNTGCQTSIQITDPFNPCPINDILSQFNTPSYSVPSETQTRFELFFNGKIAYEWIGKLTPGFTVNSPETITSVTLVQFVGDKEICRRTFSHPYSLPNPVINFNCKDGEDNSRVIVSINQETGDPKINGIKFGLGGPGGIEYISTLSGFSQNGIFTGTTTKSIPKDLIGMSYLVIHVTFTNGCSKEIELPKCNTEVTATPIPTPYAYGQCNPIGGNPTIVVSAFGFNPTTVRYSLNGGTPQISNEFPNVIPGNYIVTVTDGAQTATTPVTIFAPIEPEVYLESSTICVGGNTKLVILAESGSVFTVNTPTSTINNATTVNGRYELLIPYSLGAAGNYQVTLTSSPNGESCPFFSKTVTLAIGGQNLTPIIEIEAGTYCVGSPIRFRILNGNGATFTVSSNGTGTITDLVQAGSEYNGLYTPNTTSGQIQITGLIGSDTCNTTTNPTLLVTSTASPIIVSSTATCQPNNTVTVVVNATGATSVKIQNVDAVESPTGVWTRTGITGLTNASIVAQSGSCQSTSTVEIPNCSCPSGEPIIFANDNLCGAGNAIFTYDYFNGQTPNGSWTYRWQTLIAGNWVDQTIDDTYLPLINPVFTFGLAQNQSVTARIVFTNGTNNCQYQSAAHTVTANAFVSPPNITISPIPTTVGNSATLTASAGFSSYQWKINGTNVGTNSNTYTFVPTTAGSITVEVDVVNAQGCTATQTANFTIGVNCPDIPVTFLPSGPCQDINVQITNTTGVSIGYTVTGTGSLSTPISQTGTVPGTNIIVIDASGLDPNESVTSLDFVFTYQVGANPECTVNKTLALSYTRCQYGVFDFVDAEYTVLPCDVNFWRYSFTTSFQIPCSQPLGPKTLTYTVKFDGNVVYTQTGAFIFVNANERCTIKTLINGGSGGYVIPFSTYGGDTGVFEIEVLDGLTSLGTIVLNPALTIPASC